MRLLTLVLLSILNSQLLASKGPTDAVRDFYSSLQNDCDTALKIRPRNYTRKRCESIREIKIIKLELAKHENQDALVDIRVQYKVQKQEKIVSNEISGCISLYQRANGKWIYEEFQANRNCYKPLIIKKQPLAPVAQLVVKKPQAKPEKRKTTAKTIPPFKSSAFGSSRILNDCWPNPATLRGQPTDRKIRKLDKPFLEAIPKRLYEQAGKAFSPLPPSKQRSIRAVRIPNNKKLIALTFDLCEQADEVTGYESGIVNYLRNKGIKATFYAGGKWMKTHPEKAKQLMADPRFEVGNHAWTHGNLRVLRGEKMREQILATQAQYKILYDELKQEKCFKQASKKEQQRISPYPQTFRFPYGTCNNEALDTLADLGLPAVQWNIVTSDPWRKQTASGIARVILKKARPGSIIIAHANGRGRKTEKSLDLFIPKLLKQGYKFVTVSELLAAGKPIKTNTCYENRPGDNKHYDRIFGDGTGLKRFFK